jgi:hypothetical protein
MEFPAPSLHQRPMYLALDKPAETSFPVLIYVYLPSSQVEK